MTYPQTNWTADTKQVTADQSNATADGSFSGPLMRVQAMGRGYYNGVFRDVGDVFDIYTTGDFSNYQTNYGSVATPFYGWMKTVPSATPLFSYALANYGASTPVQGTYSPDSAGHPSLSIYPYVV